MTIYQIVNKINGKKYIGQTIQPIHRRLKNHLSKNSQCHAISSAISKYGFENFEVTVLAECYSREELNKTEAELILIHNSIFPNGYNLKSGGDGCTVSEITKSKISHTLKMKKVKPPSRLGSKITQKHKNSVSAAMIGKSKSKQSTEKMLKNRIKTNNRPVVCANDGLVYKSISEAAMKYNLNITGIWRVCTKEKTQYKGFVFEYGEK